MAALLSARFFGALSLKMKWNVEKIFWVDFEVLADDIKALHSEIFRSILHTLVFSNVQWKGSQINIGLIQIQTLAPFFKLRRDHFQKCPEFPRICIR